MAIKRKIHRMKQSNSNVVFFSLNILFIQTLTAIKSSERISIVFLVSFTSNANVCIQLQDKVPHTHTRTHPLKSIPSFQLLRLPRMHSCSNWHCVWCIFRHATRTDVCSLFSTHTHPISLGVLLLVLVKVSHFAFYHFGKISFNTFILPKNICKS